MCELNDGDLSYDYESGSGDRECSVYGEHAGEDHQYQYQYHQYQSELNLTPHDVTSSHTALNIFGWIIFIFWIF